MFFFVSEKSLNYLRKKFQSLRSYATLNVKGLIVIDLNECDLNYDGCDGNATCNDTDGSYECTCNDGYTGDGFSCSGRTFCNT